MPALDGGWGGWRGRGDELRAGDAGGLAATRSKPANADAAASSATVSWLYMPGH